MANNASSLMRVSGSMIAAVSSPPPALTFADEEAALLENEKEDGIAGDLGVGGDEIGADFADHAGELEAVTGAGRHQQGLG